MNIFKTILLLARYNFKILFGGKYIVFMIISLLMFSYFMFQIAYDGVELSEAKVFSSLMFPSLLLIFYPTTYGIQRDEESKILEIFFCTPNYMYKVWLLRLIFVFIGCYVNVLLLSYLAHLLLCPVSIFSMAYHVMFIVVFVGSLAFYLSTVIKSGNGVAVVLILLFALLVALPSMFNGGNAIWNIQLNPFKSVSNLHPDVWKGIINNSRLLLGTCSIGLILLALNNLQRREKLL